MEEEPAADNLQIKKEPCDSSDCGTCESCLEIHEFVIPVEPKAEK